MTAAPSLIGGWAVGPVVGRRPAGPLREAVEPITRRRAMFVLVDERFQPTVAPDPDSVIRAASVDHPGIAPMLDAGLLDDGTPWYVCDPLPGPVLDPDASCSPRRALVLAEEVAQALTAMHADGVVHGLVGPLTVVPGGSRHGGEPTMLLDAGVGALVGDTAPALAAAYGVSLPADRGPAADVYALGALLLRLLTNAASPSAALAALPADVRALLSSLLDPDPAGRPTAGATAARLVTLRAQVPATDAIPLVSMPAPVSVPAPAPTPHATMPTPAPHATLPTPAPHATLSAPAPTPVPAPRTATLPFAVPRTAPDVAPTLRTGPLTVVADPFPRPLRTGSAPVKRQRRWTAGRMLVVGGGVALAGLLVAVVLHLPTGQEAGVHEVAAGADDGAFGIAAGAKDRPVSTRAVSARAAAPTARTSTAAAVLAHGGATSPNPVFLRPVVSGAPLSAAATPVMTTVPATAAPVPLLVTPSPTTPIPFLVTPSPTPVVATTPESTPSSTATSSTASASATQDSVTQDSSAPASTTPSSATSPSSDPAPTAEATTPSESAAPTDSATPDGTPTDTPTPTDSATPASSATPTDDATVTPDPTPTP